MYNIYGLKWCIFCLRAISFMQEKGLEFHYYPMDDKERVLNYIKETHSHKTVPIITIETSNGEELIGGYDDFVKYIRQQKDQESD
jgi:glutaredoxin